MSIVTRTQCDDCGATADYPRTEDVPDGFAWFHQDDEDYCEDCAPHNYCSACEIRYPTPCRLHPYSCDSCGAALDNASSYFVYGSPSRLCRDDAEAFAEKWDGSIYS